VCILTLNIHYSSLTTVSSYNSQTSAGLLNELTCSVTYLTPPSQFRWPCNLRRRSEDIWLLGLQVRIPLRSCTVVSCMFVCCVGSGLCDGLITRSVPLIHLMANWSRFPWPCGLTVGQRPLDCWDCGFDSRWEQECPSQSLRRSAHSLQKSPTGYVCLSVRLIVWSRNLNNQVAWVGLMGYRKTKPIQAIFYMRKESSHSKMLVTAYLTYVLHRTTYRGPC
jgi:hypothetical protein